MVFDNAFSPAALGGKGIAKFHTSERKP